MSRPDRTQLLLSIIAAVLLAWDEQRQMRRILSAAGDNERRRYEMCQQSLDRHALDCRKCRKGKGWDCREAIYLVRIWYPAAPIR
jgi:hypothetical protein